MSSNAPVMLALAGLAYRGFQDPLPGGLHDSIIRNSLVEGLNSFAPLNQEWDLVWGPATTRQVPLQGFHLLPIFDFNAMFVVRSRVRPNRYVLSIRGTNPVSGQDWLFGDLWTATTVKWPFSNTGEVISTSTALGLVSLQQLRALPSEGRDEHLAIGKGVRDALQAFFQQGQRVLNSHFLSAPVVAPEFATQVEKTITNWGAAVQSINPLRQEIKKLKSKASIKPVSLRPKVIPKSQRKGPLDLLTFLQVQAEKSEAPLEVIVTGHSKGGALALTLGLWLKEVLNGPSNESWDPTGRSTVECYSFAGPTPGNDKFAERIDTQLAGRYHDCINEKDIVPHAFAADGLNQIPGLYNERTAPLALVVPGLVKVVGPLNYRHPSQIRRFSGTLDPNRSLAQEIIYQHLDAYLVDFGLFAQGVTTATCFV